MRTMTCAAFLATIAAMIYLPTAVAEEPDSFENTIRELSEGSFSAIKETPELRRKWWELSWKAFPMDPKVYNPDFSDFDKDRFFDSPAPARAHPRIYLRPETLSHLREQLESDPAKKKYYAIYRQNTKKLYSDKGVSKLYAAYQKGVPRDELDKTYKEHGYKTAVLMMWESLRILIDNDEAAGKSMARAVDNYGSILHAVYEERKIEEEKFYEAHRNLPDYMQEKVLGDKRYQMITQYFHEYCIAFIYDHLYRYMNDDQRANVRSLISKLTTNIWIHGMGIADTGGNWGPHHWKGAYAALAIEGEEGYEPKAVRGLRQVMTSYYAKDFTQAGMVWEGLGKGTVDPQGVLIAANRGWDLAANQNIRLAISRALTCSMLPDMENLLSLGGLGSSHSSVKARSRYSVLLRHFYPEDPAFDFLTRLYVGEELRDLEYGRGFNFHYAAIHHHMLKLICLSDYDRAKTFDQARDDAVKAHGTTFFCPEFSFLSTRTSWTPQATWLGYTVRSYNYGHTRHDRGMFTMASHGRQWSVYPYGRGSDAWGNSYAAQNCSVMSIDRQGTMGSEARAIGFVDRKHATFVTGDVKHSWDWRKVTTNNKNESISPITQRKMQPLYRGSAPYKDLPMSLYPHWLQPGEPNTPDLRVPYFPVQYAYRTVGLVKHAAPYTVIFDDLKKDDQFRTYTWHMTTEPDVIIEDQTSNTILLGERNGTRKLKIFFFDVDGSRINRTASLIDLWMGITGIKPQKQLQISTVAKGVRSTVILFPYDRANGEPRFAVTMRDGELTISHPRGKDHFQFSVNDQNLTVFNADIEGETLSYSPAYTPLPGNGPTPEYSKYYEDNE